MGEVMRYNDAGFGFRQPCPLSARVHRTHCHFPPKPWQIVTHRDVEHDEAKSPWVQVDRQQPAAISKELQLENSSRQHLIPAFRATERMHSSLSTAWQC